jgi:hypothetical protein
MINMITRILHFQEKDLGLKLHPDSLLVKDVDKSNLRDIQYRTQSNYVGQ